MRIGLARIARAWRGGTHCLDHRPHLARAVRWSRAHSMESANGFGGMPWTSPAATHSSSPSPNETREKLSFYAGIGVPEVWIVDRDTKEPEVHTLRGKAYRRRPAGPAGWTASPFAGVEMRARKGKLLMRVRGDDSTLEELPED